MRTDDNTAILDSAALRRADRRRFLRTAGATTLAAGGLSLLSACGGGSSSPTPTPTSTGTATPTPTPTATTSYSDADVYNFALNVEYLTAQFYYQAAFGAGLDAASLTGTGTQGSITGGKQNTFTDPLVAQYARELAADKKRHVGFLRTQLGSAVIAQPALNIDGSATGAFTAMARAAGVVGSSASFDPYASDANFLLAAFFFEDLAVTAYKAAAPYLATTVLREALLGIMSSAAYHASMIRATLYTKGQTSGALITNAAKISDLRDSLDGTTDDDQGLTGFGGAVNITPADNNGIIYSRAFASVLNVLFLSASSVSKGGFFPSGVNGTVNTSTGA